MTETDQTVRLTKKCSICQEEKCTDKFPYCKKRQYVFPYCKKCDCTRVRKKLYPNPKPKGLDSLNNEQKEIIIKYSNLKVPLIHIAKIIKIPYGRLCSWNFQGLLKKLIDESQPVNAV